MPFFNRELRLLLKRKFLSGSDESDLVQNREIR